MERAYGVECRMEVVRFGGGTIHGTGRTMSESLGEMELIGRTSNNEVEPGKLFTLRVVVT